MNIDGLITEAKAKFNHNSAKAYLKEKYQSKLIFADQGGLWKATPELIAFLGSCMVEQIVVLDQYENPILIIKSELLHKAIEVYNQTMRAWHEEFTELRKKR
jgi:hypothetical protein